jgi:alkanesulfonate monooxygenase SsuD/methylene tetrahydromethanopterin reductase-like flavin-dependent oxidoreductase (luciferase family)
MQQDWHGLDGEHPASRMEELVPLIRKVWRLHEGPIDHEGRFYRLRVQPTAPPREPHRLEVPIFMAGVNERMVEAAGAVADGLVGHPIQSLRWIDEVVVEGFQTGLSRSGRDRSDFDYIPTVCCAIDDDQERANDLARRTIAFYATVRTYMPLFEMHGFGDNATAAGEAFRKGDLAGVPAAISDQMVDAYCAAGPVDKVRERVEQTAERADGLFLTPPTYFVSPEELSEYQRRIVEAFGPNA